MATFNHENYAPDFNWFETVYEDARTDGALIGFDVENIFFSGFWAQGDGAQFIGGLGYAKGCVKAVKEYAPRDAELISIAEDWAAMQRANFYSITGRVTSSGHYSHSGCTSFEFEDSRYGRYITTEAFDECAAVAIVRRFMDWIYEKLRTEYEYQSAWLLALAYGETLPETITRSSRELARTLRGLRKVKALLPSPVKYAIESRVNELRDEIRDAIVERQEIAENFHYWRDGQRVDVAAFFADNY